MRRYAQSKAFTLTHGFYDGDGEPVDLTGKSVALTIRSALDPTFPSQYVPVELADGDMFTAKAPPLGVGVYAAYWDLSDPDTESSNTDYLGFEITNGPIFTVQEFRASHRDLADPVDFPGAEIAAYRDQVEEEFETITGRSFTLRAASVPLDLDGRDAIWTGKFDTYVFGGLSTLRNGYTEANADLTALTPTLDENGVLSGLSGAPEGRASALIIYGFVTPPLDIKRAAMVRVRHLMAATDSGIPDRATSFMAANGGQFQLATPGRAGYKTGVPEVDAVLTTYTRKVLLDVIGALG